jgi:hypothetical protein
LQNSFSNNYDKEVENEDGGDNEIFLFCGGVGGEGSKFEESVNDRIFNTHLVNLLTTSNNVSSTYFNIIDSLSKVTSLSANILNPFNTVFFISFICFFHSSCIQFFN